MTAATVAVSLSGIPHCTIVDALSERRIRVSSKLKATDLIGV